MYSMAAKMDFLVLSENVQVDEKKKITIINNFDSIYVDKVPFIQEKFVLSFKVRIPLKEIKDDYINLNVQIKSPTDKKMLSANAKQDVIESFNRGNRFEFTSFCDLSGRITFGEFGEHKVLFNINDELVNEIFFFVNQNEVKEDKK